MGTGRWKGLIRDESSSLSCNMECNCCRAWRSVLVVVFVWWKWSFQHSVVAFSSHPNHGSTYNVASYYQERRRRCPPLLESSKESFRSSSLYSITVRNEEVSSEFHSPTGDGDDNEGMPFFFASPANNVTITNSSPLELHINMTECNGKHKPGLTERFNGEASVLSDMFGPSVRNSNGHTYLMHGQTETFTRSNGFSTVSKTVPEVLDMNDTHDYQHRFGARNLLKSIKKAFVRNEEGVQGGDQNVSLVNETVTEPVVQQSLPLRSLWRRRHARTLEEGIRREQSSELSFLLNKAQWKGRGRRFVERTIMGLINALAEEVEDLDVSLKAVSNTPLWRKEVEELRIGFSRLGFKPLRIGGMKERSTGNDTELSLVQSADEAFDRIDVDNSGTLDRDEIALALSLVSALKPDKESLDELAAELVDLYDTNGDGVVDREEYQRMIEDMASLKQRRKESEEGKALPLSKQNKTENLFSGFKKSVMAFSEDISSKANEVKNMAVEVATATKMAVVNGTRKDQDNHLKIEKEKEFGSIVMSGLKLDLRRLVFGGFPLVKTVSCTKRAFRVRMEKLS